MHPAAAPTAVRPRMVQQLGSLSKLVRCLEGIGPDHLRLSVLCEREAGTAFETITNFCRRSRCGRRNAPDPHDAIQACRR